MLKTIAGILKSACTLFSILFFFLFTGAVLSGIDALFFSLTKAYLLFGYSLAVVLLWQLRKLLSLSAAVRILIQWVAVTAITYVLFIALQGFSGNFLVSFVVLLVEQIAFWLAVWITYSHQKKEIEGKKTYEKQF